MASVDQPEEQSGSSSASPATPSASETEASTAHPKRQQSRKDALAAAEDLQPQVVREPIENVDNDELTAESLNAFITAAVDADGLVGHNVRAFNSLINEGIPQILTELFSPVENTVSDLRDQTEMDRLRESIKMSFSFSDPQVGRPIYATYPMGKIKPLYPNEARLSQRTYAAPLRLAAEVSLTAYYTDGREETKRAGIPPFQVAPLPIMVGSDRCHTWNLTREGRKQLEEDPNESGGYFLANTPMKLEQYHHG